MDISSASSYSRFLRLYTFFHPSTDELLKFLTPELEVMRVGLAESWRGGLRVVLRQ